MILTCQYFRQALTACEQISKDRVIPRLHLQAQLYYRLGQTSEAINLYKELLQTHKVSIQAKVSKTVRAFLLKLLARTTESNLLTAKRDLQVHSLELSTNVVAAHVAAGRSKFVPDVMSAMRIGPHEGFEVAFNLGCAQLASGDLEAAHDQLLHAQRLGVGPLAAPGSSTHTAVVLYMAAMICMHLCNAY